MSATCFRKPCYIRYSVGSVGQDDDSKAYAYLHDSTVPRLLEHTALAPDIEIAGVCVGGRGRTAYCIKFSTYLAWHLVCVSTNEKYMQQGLRPRSLSRATGSSFGGEACALMVRARREHIGLS
jgi:hypothetical protein